VEFSRCTVIGSNFDSLSKQNHWKSPTYMVNVNNPELNGGGKYLKDAIWDAVKSRVEEWTEGTVTLRPSSLYGIRVSGYY